MYLYTIIGISISTYNPLIKKCYNSDYTKKVKAKDTDMEQVLVQETPEEKVKKLRNFIKYEAANDGLTLTDIYLKLNKQYGTNPNVSNFSSKMRRGTLPIIELYRICEVLNLDIEFKRRPQ